MGLSIAEIDAALERALAVPVDKRTTVWHGLVDGLLEQRLRLDMAAPRGRADIAERETRVMRVPETR